MIKFSIITVVKNDKKNILKTLNCIKNQTFKNFEHIIFDSNSTDGTSQLISKNLNSNTIYYRKKDSGIYHALNKAIKLAKGEYIGILHSGDLLKNKDTLKEINKHNKKYDYFYSDLIFFKKKKIIRYWKNKMIYNLFFLNIPHTTLFLKKSVFKKIGYYNESYKISSDLDFIIRLCKEKNFKGKYLNFITLLMKVGGLSTSNKNIFLKVKEDLIILRKYFKVSFFLMYLYKVFIKFPQFLIIKKNIYEKI